MRTARSRRTRVGALDVRGIVRDDHAVVVPGALEDQRQQAALVHQRVVAQQPDGTLAIRAIEQPAVEHGGFREVIGGPGVQGQARGVRRPAGALDQPAVGVRPIDDADPVRLGHQSREVLQHHRGRGGHGDGVDVRDVGRAEGRGAGDDRQPEVARAHQRQRPPGQRDQDLDIVAAGPGAQRRRRGLAVDGDAHRGLVQRPPDAVRDALDQVGVGRLDPGHDDAHRARRGRRRQQGERRERAYLRHPARVPLQVTRVGTTVRSRCADVGHGGLAFDLVTYLVVLEELAWGDPALAMAAAAKA